MVGCQWDDFDVRCSSPWAVGRDALRLCARARPCVNHWRQGLRIHSCRYDLQVNGKNWGLIVVPEAVMVISSLDGPPRS
jgi:hypothetical protein